MVLAASEIPAAPVLIFMALGVIIALVGHMSKSRSLILTGLLILFMATAAMVVGAYIDYEGGGTDPREKDDPKEPNL